MACFIGPRSPDLKLLVRYLLSAGFSVVLAGALNITAMAQATAANANSAPANASTAKPATPSATPAKSSTTKPLTKQQERQKFVLDVVHSAIALPEADPQDRLRVLSAAVGVVTPIDQKLADQLAKEGTAIETKLVAEGQKPAVSMLGEGHVDCASAATFVEMVPPSAVVNAQEELVGAITNCPKQVDEAAKAKLEAGVAQGVVAGSPILALMNTEGMDSQWSQSMFTRMFSSLPSDDSMAEEAPNYAAMFSQVGQQMNKDVVKSAGTNFLQWLGQLPASPQRSVAINMTSSLLSDKLGPDAYQELLRSDVNLQQTVNSAEQNAQLPPPDAGEQNVSVLQAQDNTSDRTGQLRAMSPAQRAREAAASGFASGTSGDRKMADHYFDIAFAAVDETWAERGDSGVNAPEVVQEVSDAAAQVDPVAALKRAQQLQDPSAEAISMLSVARVVAGQQ